MLTSRSGENRFAKTGSIDANVEKEVDLLPFAPETEAEFKTSFIQRSLPRARWATAIYLALVAVVLAVVARPILAGILLFIGMAGVLLIGAASVDPLLATRLPEGWPTRRLVVVSMAVIVSGLLLVAF